MGLRMFSLTATAACGAVARFSTTVTVINHDATETTPLSTPKWKENDSVMEPQIFFEDDDGCLRMRPIHPSGFIHPALELFETEDGRGQG